MGIRAYLERRAQPSEITEGKVSAIVSSIMNAEASKLGGQIHTGCDQDEGGLAKDPAVAVAVAYEGSLGAPPT